MSRVYLDKYSILLERSSFKVVEEKEQFEALLEEISREVLAEKIISNKHLTVSERKCAYQLLTGNKAPETKRGRKTESERDMYIAKFFLILKYEKNMCSKYIIANLGKAFNLQGKEAVEDQLVYKAVNRGIKSIKIHLNRSVKLSPNKVTGFEHINKQAQEYYLNLIDKYKKDAE